MAAKESVHKLLPSPIAIPASLFFHDTCGHIPASGNGATVYTLGTVF